MLPFTFQRKLFIALFMGFIAATVIGTLVHECGHYFAALYYGGTPHMSYAYTNYGMPEVTPAQSFTMTVWGPLQTIITGTIGVLLLVLYLARFRSAAKLSLGQWLIVYTALFWLRPVFNFIKYVYILKLKGAEGVYGDEFSLSRALDLHWWTLSVVTAIAGVAVFFAVLRFIPVGQRFTFLLAGLTGGIAGAILWLGILGPVLMP